MQQINQKPLHQNYGQQAKQPEKYLTVQVLGSLKVNCFRNKGKASNPKAPDFTGGGVAVWVNKKEAN